MKKAVNLLESVIYWLIIILPFSMAIAPAPKNVFTGLLIASFVALKIIKREKLFTRTGVNLALSVFLAFTCISLFYSANIANTLKGGIFRLLQYIFILMIVAEKIRDKKHIYRILFSVAAGLVLVSIDSFWQVIRGADFIRGYAPVVNIGLVRATASFKDSNTFGIYLSALAPLVLGLSLYHFKGARKIFFTALSLVIISGIVITYSRPTLLAVYLAILFLAIVRKDRLVIGVIILAGLLAPLIMPRSVKNWAKECNYNPLRLLCNDDRIAIYRNTLNMIKEHPVRGVGANNFMESYRYYKEVPEYRNIVTSDYIYAHNNFLHLAGELGLAGLAVFIWFLTALFRRCRRIYTGLNDEFLRIISLSLSACLIAFLVNGLTESSLYSSRVAMTFWYLAGFSLGLAKFVDAHKR